MDYKLKFVRLMRLGKMRDVFDSNHFNVSCSSVFEHIYGFFDCITFSGYIKLRTIHYITPLFRRAKFSGYFYFFHGKSPYMRLLPNIAPSGRHVNNKHSIPPLSCPKHLVGRRKRWTPVSAGMKEVAAVKDKKVTNP